MCEKKMEEKRNRPVSIRTFVKSDAHTAAGLSLAYTSCFTSPLCGLVKQVKQLVKQLVSLVALLVRLVALLALLAHTAG